MTAEIPRTSDRPRGAARSIGLLTSVGSTLDAFFPEIVEHWTRAGVRVSTAAGDRSRRFAEQRVIDGMTRTPRIANVRAPKALRAWVRRDRLDVVITSTATASALSRIAALPAPVVYFCHGLHWNGSRLRDAPFRAAERLLLHRSAGVICINDADEEWFADRAPHVPRVRLPGGVGLDVGRYAREPREAWRPGEPLRLVWCGEFTARKQPEAAVALVEALLARGVPVELDMLGEGARWAPLRDRVGSALPVRFPGYVDPRPHFARAHALVQTSRWEGLPRVALEAVAMGIPTAGFDVKGVRDVPGTRTAPGGDIEALADAVLDAARTRGEDLPDPALLSYTRAADEILAFVDRVAPLLASAAPPASAAPTASAARPAPAAPPASAAPTVPARAEGS